MAGVSFFLWSQWSCTGKVRFGSWCIAFPPPSPAPSRHQPGLAPQDGGTRVGSEAPTGSTWARVAGCRRRVRYEGVAHPRQPDRPLQEQVRAGCEDRATRPPCNGRRRPVFLKATRFTLVVKALVVHVRGRWIDSSWLPHLEVWRCTPTLGSRRTRHAAALPHQASQFKPPSEVYTTLGSRRARHAASLPHRASSVQ